MFEILPYFMFPIFIIGLIIFIIIKRNTKSDAKGSLAITGEDAFFELMTLSSFGFLSIFISEMGSRLMIDINWYNLILPVFIFAIIHSYYFKSLLSLEVGLLGASFSLFSNITEWFANYDFAELIPIIFTAGVISYCLYKLHYNSPSLKKISYVYLINSVVIFAMLCAASVFYIGGFYSATNVLGIIQILFCIVAIGLLVFLHLSGNIETLEIVGIAPMLLFQYLLPKINPELLLSQSYGGSSLTIIGIFYIIVAVLLSLACLFGLQYQAEKRADHASFKLFNGASILFLVMMIFPRFGYDIFSTILFNLIGLGAMTSYLLFGYKTRNEGMINVGAGLFVLMIFVQYINTFSGLDKSLVFITAGFLLLILGWGMEKGRRYLLTYIREENPLIR